MFTSVASGTPALGRFPVEATGPALVYLAEDALPRVRDRVAQLCRHRGLHLSRLDLQVVTADRLRLDTEHDQLALAQTVERIRPALLLLDPLVRLHSLDENSASDISSLLGFLRAINRRYQLALVLVHHMAKRSRRNLGQSLRGSSDLHAWTDSACYLVRRPDDRLQLTVEHRSAPSGRALARAPVGGGFPALPFRLARWVHSSTIGHVSSAPPEVGSRTGAPTVGSGGYSNRFRVGPQSGSPGHVSSPRLVKRSMRISRTTLSCLLRVKGYVAVRVGSAFRAAHSSRFLLHLFQPCPPVFPPGSAFAFTYILCLRSRSLIGAFIISPLPPMLPKSLQTAGSLPSTGVTRLHRYYQPLRHPLACQPTSRCCRLYDLPCSADFSTGRGGLLQLLSASSSPCRRYHPARVS